MILPVFALYAEQLQGVTPMLMGLAIGMYGSTQALFGISDRIGRKPVTGGGGGYGWTRTTDLSIMSAAL